MNGPDNQSIAYQLNLVVRKRIRISVGRLGALDFPAGAYIYTGSAQKNMEARIRRHLARQKKLHWHIDFLLMNRNVDIARVDRFSVDECILNQSTKGVILFPGFGASDCRNGCVSHLKYLGRTGTLPVPQLP